MPDLVRRWTRKEVLALPDDGNRYELIDGQLLVSPSPGGRHQRAIALLFRRIDPYVREHRLGSLVFSPADLDLECGQVSQPDLFVGAMRHGREPVEWADFGIPILVVEVLSPSTARFDRVVKRRRYQASGVACYWVVDLDARAVDVWAPTSDFPAVIDATLEWRPNAHLLPLILDLPSYFRDVWGESNG